MATEKERIEQLIAKAQLTEAQLKFNEFLELCDEQKENLLQSQFRASQLQSEFDAGTIDRDGVIERNKITFSFAKGIKTFKKELGNYFNVSDGKDFFDSIHSRDDIIVKALESRLIDKQYTRGLLLTEGNTSIIYQLSHANTRRDALALVLKVSDLLPNTKKDFIDIMGLRHQNIIKLLDYELDKFPYFIIREFVHGECLTQIIDKTGARPLSQMIDWIYQLAGALDYLCHKKIVHTNVRTSKLIIDEDMRIMMSPLDFSNAYKVGERTLSRYQDVCLYGSPELLDNDGEALQVSQMCLSDQYSLGLIAYKIVTGKALFEGDSIVKILKSRHLFIKDKQYRAEKLKVFPSGVLGQVFIRLLNENPSQRFPNLHEVVKALHPHTQPTKKTRKTDAVRDSYQRCLAINPSLIDDFYKKLYEKLPEIQADFKNPKRQLVMLQMAIDVLIDIDEKRPLLNALMTNTQHQSYTFKKFEDFIGTLIETIKANDTQWASVESAWEVLRDKTITAIQEARASVE